MGELKIVEENYNNFNVKEENLYEFLKEENVSSMLYTGIYYQNQEQKHIGLDDNNRARYYETKEICMFKRTNSPTLYAVSMNQTDLEKVIEIIRKHYNPNNGTRGFKIYGRNQDVNTRAPLALNELVYLYYQNPKDFKIDKEISTGSRINVVEKDVYKLLKEVIKLDREIKKRNLQNKKYELIKFIYDKYKMEANYWFPDNYYKERKGDLSLINDENKTARYPYNYAGMILEQYATCSGLASGLCELFKLYGIKTAKVSNSLHAGTKIYLEDEKKREKVSYLDLAAEISPQWKDSLYNGYQKRKIPIKCYDKNSYHFFLKAHGALGAWDDEDQRKKKAIDVTENMINEIEIKKGLVRV